MMVILVLDKTFFGKYFLFGGELTSKFYQKIFSKSNLGAFLRPRKKGVFQMKKKKSREIWKKTGQDLQDYLLFRKRGSQLTNRKQYNRQKAKREGKDEE